MKTTASTPGSSGHASMLYVGFDYQLHPAILVGVLVQFDWMSETSSGSGHERERPRLDGRPVPERAAYAQPVLRCASRLGAIGQPRRSVGHLYGQASRPIAGLVSGKLTGNWSFGKVQFRPSAEIIYFHETQKSYVNQLNIFIPGAVDLARPGDRRTRDRIPVPAAGRCDLGALHRPEGRMGLCQDGRYDHCWDGHRQQPAPRQGGRRRNVLDRLRSIGAGVGVV